MCRSIWQFASTDQGTRTRCRWLLRRCRSLPLIKHDSWISSFCLFITANRPIMPFRGNMCWCNKEESAAYVPWRRLCCESGKICDGHLLEALNGWRVTCIVKWWYTEIFYVKLRFKDTGICDGQSWEELSENDSYLIIAQSSIHGTSIKKLPFYDTG